MCADNISESRAEQSVQPLRSAQHVGRVGALAVALGIGVGVGVFGQTATAAADSNSAGSGEDSADTGRATRAPHTGVRNSSAQGGSESPAPANAVDAPAPRAAAATVEIPTVTPQPQRDGVLRHTRIALSVDAPAPAAPSVPEVQTPVAAPAPTPAVTVPSAATPVIAAPVVQAPAVAAAAAQQAPAMTVAEPGALASGAEDPLAALGGGTGGPGTEPLAWAAAAVARREDLAGATPEVPAAASVGTGEPADSAPVVGGRTITVTGFQDTDGNTITSANIGQTIVILGTNFNGTGSLPANANVVIFGCTSQSKEGCANGGVTVNAANFKIVQDKNGNATLTVKVPVGAPTGYVQVNNNNASGVIPGYSKDKFVINGAAVIDQFGITPGNIGGTVTIDGSNFTGATAVNVGGAESPSFSVNGDGSQITAVVPDQAVTGSIQVTTPIGTATSANPYQVILATPLPEKPVCDSGPCAALDFAGAAPVINAISAQIAKIYPDAGPAGKCTKAGCPIPVGQTTPSVANTIGEYAYNLLYALAGPVDDAVIGQQLVNLVTQPNVLTFISQTVASNKMLSKLPPAVGTLMGNVAASFIENTVGNLTLATALAPFLNTFNFSNPSQDFVSLLLANKVNEAVLKQFNSTQWPLGQAALTTFLQTPDVQAILGQAVSGAVKQLFGLTPSPAWAPSVPSTTLSNYLGQVGASKLLHVSVAEANPLAVTIGTATQTLFNAIGNIVATSAGNAVVTLLQQPALPGQPNSVATSLANLGVNGIVAYLGGTITPFPDQEPLNKALAAGAGVAVNQFVTSLFTAPNLAPVTQALGQFVSTVVPGVLGDTLFQAEVSDQISAKLVKLLGPTLSDQFGAAVAGLLGNTVVSGAVVNLLNTTLGSLLNAQGVGSALGYAAGVFTTAYMAGASQKDAQAQALAALKANAAFDAAIGPAVTAGVQQALQDTNLWNTVDATLNGLFIGLFNSIVTDPTVQAEVIKSVTDLVKTKLPGELGDLVGQQAGDAVLSLLSNSTVQSAVIGLFDTIVGDFWRSPGMVTAFSQAAGELATGWAEDNTDIKAQVLAELKANPQVVAAVNNSVVAAVTDFVGNTGVWQAVDSTVTGLLGTLINDPQLQTALSDYVQAAVERKLPLPLGSLVGAQVGAAVVGLLTNPVLDLAVTQLVDTVTQDFFGAQGVAQAFGVAAGEVALGALAGDYKKALADATKQLQDNTDVQTGIETAVGDAVGQFLGNTGVWQAVDGAVTGLLGTLIGDPQVQTALGDYVQSAVEAKIPGSLGTLVGAQVAATVVGLVTNPVIDSAVAGLVDSMTTDFFTSFGVVPELAGVAAQLVLVAVTGGDLKQAEADAQQELRESPVIDAGIGTAVGDAVAQFLGNTQVWQQVDLAVTSLLGTLIGDPQVQTALSDYVSAQVQAALPGQLGILVGPQVGAAVVSFITNPVVEGALHDLLDTVAEDFFDTPGVVNAFADSASGLAVQVFTGANFADALAYQEFLLRNNPVVDDAAQASVGAAVTQFLGETAVWQVLDSTVTSLLTGLVTDPQVQAALADDVSARVQKQIPGAVGQLIGDQVGAAVVSLLTNPVVGGALLDLVDTVAYDFFSTPGVDATIGNSAGDLAVLLITGGNFNESLATVEDALRVNPIIDEAANGSVGAAVTQFIGDAAVWTQVGQTLDSLVTNLLGDQSVEQYAGDQAAAFVTKFLGTSPIASPVGDAVGAAVQQLLATTGVASALGDIVGALLPDLFGQPGVPAEVGDVAAQYAVALLTFQDQKQARQEAIAALESSTAIQDGVRATIAAELNIVNTELLSVANIQQSLGLITTTLLTTLAGDPEVQTFVGHRYGLPVADFLANTAAVNKIASVLGTTVTDLLGYTGFSTALTDALDVFANALLDGDSQGTAIQDALQSLRSDPAFDSAITSIIPDSINTILSDRTVRDAAGTLAQGEAVARLEKSGINNKFLLGIAGNVANGTVESFLGKHPAQKLVDELAVNVILGKTPLSDATNFLINGLYRPIVAIALGGSVGHGIGTIFGHNVIGEIIGLAAGLPGTVMVAALESLYAIYQLVFGWLGKGRPAAGVSPAAVLRTLTQTSQAFGGPLPTADPAASLMVTGTGLLAFKFQAA